MTEPITDEQRAWWQRELARALEGGNPTVDIGDCYYGIAGLIARLQQVEAERDEAVQAQKTLARQLDRRASGQDDLTRALEARIAELEAAIQWALGGPGSTFGRDMPEDAPRYWWRKELRRRANLSPPSGGTDDITRCAWCGWPLRERFEDGCVRGNCSQRPLPTRLYAPVRAEREIFNPSGGTREGE